MFERAQMLIGLVQQILGPGAGMRERLPAKKDPWVEYMTGVLAPETVHDYDDPDGGVDDFGQDIIDDEEQLAEGTVISSPTMSPALNPKRQPRSMGLTFIIQSENVVDTPVIDVCMTWARYKLTKDGWERDPHCHIEENISLESVMNKGISNGVSIHLRASKQSDNTYRTSIYFVNRAKYEGNGRPDTSYFVFQPQVRIRCTEGSKIIVLNVDHRDVAFVENDPSAREDAQLAMLYRNRLPMARGHMVGVMWNEIDTERDYADEKHPKAPPFYWIDKEIVVEKYSEEAADYFTQPDVRTDFTPTYAIEAPEYDWNEDYGISPELRPDVLSEMWNASYIESNLMPMVAGYQKWIVTQENKIEALHKDLWKTLASDNIRQCKTTLERIEAGIQWLLDDEEVRLAFCFANKAIALQSQWARNTVFPWRPFQLAFILMNIPAIADPLDESRTICDLLWFPTGGGKTEAYLGLAAFTIGLRRLRALSSNEDYFTERGLSVLSRYTLRLLTIQQFRRATRLITACEFLRVSGLKVDDTENPAGWRPEQCPFSDDFLWGTSRLSIGLWVGGSVTPNNTVGFTFRHRNNRLYLLRGAIETLQGITLEGYRGPSADLMKEAKGKKIIGDGEPAQILNCPACNSVLAIPESGLDEGQHTIYFMYRGQGVEKITPDLFSWKKIEADTVTVHYDENNQIRVLELTFTLDAGSNLTPNEVDEWWYNIIRPHLKGDTEHTAARPARPGYIIRYYSTGSNKNAHDFEIYCPNPGCDLNNNVAWAEQVPVDIDATRAPTNRKTLFSSNSSQRLSTSDRYVWQTVVDIARSNTSRQIGSRIPITAYTTDDQIYHRVPTMIVATVDKFARLAYEPKAASLFGNVEYYHSRWGYYRKWSPPNDGYAPKEDPQAHPAGSRSGELHREVTTFSPPDLVLQDELHLIEGPLGSMVGLYETAIDILAEGIYQKQKIRPKYIASTATVRQATEQVQALFNRELAQFPPSAIDVDDRFFAVSRRKDIHQLDERNAGRLYVAVGAPGKGAQTPIVRIWSALLQRADHLLQNGYSREDIDHFWTLVGYFNALRELAGAAALYRQDIPERIETISDTFNRMITETPLELSSRAESQKLPALLEKLNKDMCEGEPVVLSTSMFGTGVDISRLGLMVVHGQPKTTSAYIQATGRVGRSKGGLVVSFFRVTRPRDLDHYEFFSGYHRMLYRAVEPVTVTPYAPRARERGLGPLAVALLRQARIIGNAEVNQQWHIEQRLQGSKRYSAASIMREHRYAPEVQALLDVFESRSQTQPELRRPEPGITKREIASDLDRWEEIASKQNSTTGTNDLVYDESTLTKDPERDVVLGDAQHQRNDFRVAYRNAPNSLRDVEETTGFEG